MYCFSTLSSNNLALKPLAAAKQVQTNKNLKFSWSKKQTKKNPKKTNLKIPSFEATSTITVR